MIPHTQITIMAGNAMIPVKVPAKLQAPAPPELKGTMSVSPGTSSSCKHGPKIKNCYKLPMKSE